MSEDEGGINNSPWIDCFFFFGDKEPKCYTKSIFWAKFPFYYYFLKIHQILFLPLFFSLLGEHDITGLSTGYCSNGPIQKCGQLSENLSGDACQSVTLQNFFF
jgi:hypothetical protein